MSDKPIGTFHGDLSDDEQMAALTEHSRSDLARLVLRLEKKLAAAHALIEGGQCVWCDIDHKGEDCPYEHAEGDDEQMRPGNYGYGRCDA